MSDDDATLAPTMGEGLSAPESGGGPGPVGVGDTIGRFVVVSRLGAGAMGVVFAGYDPELDRKVALKLLQPGQGTAATQSDAKTRLVREAQALAKLSHPGVVAVHDVGTVDDRVWLAMEFVDGETLAAWRRAEPRDWEQVVKVMQAAGQGLAAAHEAGLLHRDFKPDNVMVDREGRVRVMDFGLARADRSAEDAGVRAPADALATEESPALSGSTGALSLEVTKAGAIMGTPAYMSPEQWMGEKVSAAADQFGYCVTLWEALFGQRPFPGDNPASLAMSVTQGRLRTPPPRSGVPGWLRRVCARGLSRRPEDRWPSMTALLAAIDRGLERAKARRITAGVGALALAAGAVWGYAEVDDRMRIAECDALGASISEVWDDETRARVSDALLATGLGFASSTAVRTVDELDGWSTRWREVRERTCGRHQVARDWDRTMRMRADHCLAVQRIGFEALVDRLQRGGPAMARSAVESVQALGRPEQCGDERALVVRPLPSAQQRDVTLAVRSTLARARTAELVEDPNAALERAREALAQAESSGFEPLLASAHLRVGILLVPTGEYEQAEDHLRIAYRMGGVSGAPVITAQAADKLVAVTGVHLARPRAGKVWAAAAEVEVAKLELDEDGTLTASRLQNLAALQSMGGDYDSALASRRRALEITERILGPRHSATANALSMLAAALLDLKRYDEALEAQERARSILEEVLGKDHPDLAGSLTNQAIILDELGRGDEALELYERALVLEREGYGEGHPAVARSLNNLAAFRLTIGEAAPAKKGFEAVLALQEAALGRDHPDVASTLNNLATAHRLLDDAEAGRPHLERALKIHEAALGPDHPDVAMVLSNLATLDVAAGDLESARNRFERALKIRRATFGGDDERVARTLLSLGDLAYNAGDAQTADPFFVESARIYRGLAHPPRVSTNRAILSVGYTALDLGRPADAIEPAETVVKARSGPEEDPELLGEAQWILARALWAAPAGAGRDRARAVEVMTRALQNYRKAGVAESEQAALEQWLRKRGRPAAP